MTIDQYEAEFTRLSRFALRMVEHPEDKARRFRDGLKPDLRSQMISLNIKDYSEMYERAQAIERDQTDRAAASGSRFALARDNRRLGKKPMAGNRRFVPPIKKNIGKLNLQRRTDLGLASNAGVWTIKLGIAPSNAPRDPRCNNIGLEIRLGIRRRLMETGRRHKDGWSRGGTSIPWVSSVEATKLLDEGYQGYLASVVDPTVGEMRLEDIPVVCNFPDVFPQELPGLPPVREVEFVIELAPGTEPISQPPYRMSLSELKELKVQMQELLDKGFIRPSASPWGAPVLFVRKKDGSLRVSPVKDPKGGYSKDSVQD
ncbi:hypothetical protein NL676_011898 [Syzygium grande]|nr:hypothetical protein NL676_011898 [Syzygium grande]